jgi:hypothetical protein
MIGKLFILLILFILHSFLIIYSNESADIQVYIRRLDANLFYETERFFSYIQYFLGFIDNHELEIQLVRFLILITFVTSCIRIKSSVSFLFLLHPIIILSIHNSIREGMALAITLLALTYIHKNLFKIILLITAAFTHISAIIGIWFSVTFSSAFSNINKYKFLILTCCLTIGFVITLTVLDYFAGLFGKIDYIRSQVFTGGRYGSEIKALYFLILGIFPLLLSKFGIYKLRDLLRFIFLLFFAASIYLNIATDALVRLLYFVLIADFFYILSFESRKFTRRGLTLIHIGNPSGLTLLSKIL